MKLKRWLQLPPLSCLTPGTVHLLDGVFVTSEESAQKSSF